MAVERVCHGQFAGVVAVDDEGVAALEFDMPRLQVVRVWRKQRMGKGVAAWFGVGDGVPPGSECCVWCACHGKGDCACGGEDGAAAEDFEELSAGGHFSNLHVIQYRIKYDAKSN